MPGKARRVRVETRNAGERLDKFIARSAGLSRRRAREMVESGSVKVDGEERPPDYQLGQGQDVTYASGTEKKREGKLPEVRVIYEDEELAVIDKAPGVVVHPAPGTVSMTLLDALQKRYRSPELVHRLDKDTSGVMAVALNERAASFIRRQFRDRTVKKEYLTIAEGTVSPPAGEINAPLKRSSRSPDRMSVSWVGARSSATRYSLVESSGGTSLLEVYPLSGRTHQIRAHLAHLGSPVLGDTRYGSGRGGVSRQMLHAYRISFEIPGSNKRKIFCSPPPEDFTLLLRKLGYDLKKIV